MKNKLEIIMIVFVLRFGFEQRQSILLTEIFCLLQTYRRKAYNCD